MKVVLILVVIEGDAGCRAELPEFSIALGVSSRAMAITGLGQMLNDHCQTLLARGDTSQATEAQLDLARKVIANGFEFQERPPVRASR